MQKYHDTNELNCGIFCKIKNVYSLSYVGEGGGGGEGG